MLLLFPTNPLAPRESEPAFARDVNAAKERGFEVGLIDFDALVAGDVAGSVRKAPKGARRAAIYRGWMMRPPVYGELYAALAARGIELVNDASAYAAAHLFPGWYDLLGGATPRSVVRPGLSLPRPDELATLLAPFGDGPVLIKDYVKSRKHEWREACYVPRASDTDAAMRIVERFFELQGDDLEGGLVVRAYEELAHAGTHPKSGMPIARESRIFFLDGEPLLAAPYWDVVDDRRTRDRR